MGSYEEQNFYELLDVEPSASLEEIRQAFQKAKSTYSEDSPALYTMFTPEEASQLRALIDEAYATLSNHSSRREYDHKIFSDSNTEDLPDLKYNEEPADEFIEKFKSTQNPMNDEALEDLAEQGMACTRWSKYKLDPVIEEEISQQEYFDGSFLKKVREYKQIEVELISDISRIGKSYIYAIENNDFKSLPADVFVRGFVKQIASILDLNIDKVVNSYMKICKDSRA